MVRCSCFAWRFDGKDQRAQQRRVRGPEQQQPAPQQQQEPGPLPLPGPAPLQQPAGAAPAKLLRTELPLQRPVGTGGAIPGARPAPLRVMTFNILADGLAQHGDFVNTPPEALTWDYRFPRLIEEIVEGRCDIVCLQEANHFDEIAAALQPHGLAGFFLPKHPAPPERFGCPPDGTALFYRASRLAPVDGPRGAPYQRLPSGGGGASKGGKADGGGPMTQGYVIATLRDVASGRLLVAAATHLKAKDGGPNDETRRIQAQQLLEAVASARQAAACFEAGGDAAGGGAGAPEPAVLVMGDFNAVAGSPACQAVLQHPELQLQSVWDVPWAASKADTRDTCSSSGGGAGVNGAASSSEQQAEARAGQQPDHWQQPEQQQQQQQQQQQHQEPEFSTWKFRTGGEARRVIDHMYFSGGKLAPSSRWRMLRADEIGPGGLPCAAYPSDHMALLCEFEWR